MVDAQLVGGGDPSFNLLLLLGCGYYYGLEIEDFLKAYVVAVDSIAVYWCYCCYCYFY